MGPTCPKPASHLASWKKSPPRCWKNWERVARAPLVWEQAVLADLRNEVPDATPKTRIILTKTKTRACLGMLEIITAAIPAPRSQRYPLVPTTLSRTLRSSSPAGARSSPSPKRRWKSLQASADFAPDRGYATLNMGKARSTSAKEKAKKPRLRY